MHFSWGACHSFLRGAVPRAGAAAEAMAELEAFAPFPLAPDHRAMLETPGWQVLEVDFRPYGALCDVRLHLYDAADCVQASAACGLPKLLPQTLVLGHNGKGDLLVLTAAERPRGIYRVAPRRLGPGLAGSVYIAPDVTALLNRAVNVERLFGAVPPEKDAECRVEAVAVEDSYARAMAQHADLAGDAASGFMDTFDQWLHSARRVYDPLLQSPDWPEVLAAQVRGRLLQK